MRAAHLLSVWDGLGVFTTALAWWIFFTPCTLVSLTWYLPPLIVGAMLGFLGESRSRVGWLSAALAYGVALAAFATAVIYYTEGPWTALASTAAVIFLLMVPLAAVGLAAGRTAAATVKSSLKRRWRRFSRRAFRC